MRMRLVVVFVPKIIWLPTTTTTTIATSTIVDYILLLEVLWLPTLDCSTSRSLRVLRRVAVLMFETIWLPTAAILLLQLLL